MPSLHVHRVVAARTLEAWAAEGESSPFRPSCPSSENAFYAGAYGPDLGYFPGGYRVISDLAHCVRTGELTRRLLQTARTPVERAFAAGWLTHVLGDVLIHPAVALAVGRVVGEDGTVPVDGASAPAAHVRVETGLDAWFAARTYRVPLMPVFDQHSVQFLRSAFRHVYGLDVPAERFLASQRAAVRGSRVGCTTIAWLGRLARREPMPVSRIVAAAIGTLRTVLGAARLRPLALALLTPEPPGGWLLAHTEACIERVPGMVRFHLATRGRELADFNLDTGQAAASSADHATTRAMLRFLGWEGCQREEEPERPSVSAA